MKLIKNIKKHEEMPKIVIPVSSRIIANAIKADSHHCMIADAIKKRIPKAQYISVDLQSVRFTDPDEGIRYKYFTPLFGQQALVKFDRGDVVKPFTITLKDGIKEKAGWVGQANRKGTRKYKPRKKTAYKRKGLAKKERKFGLRNLE